MAVNNKLIPIGAIDDYWTYGGDPDHERHRFHEIQKIPTIQGAPSEEAFVAMLKRSVANASLKPTFDPNEIAGIGWVVRFDQGTRLTEGEKKRVEAVLVKITGSRQSASWWHLGLCGADDLHHFTPEVDLLSPDVSLRTRHDYLLGRARAAMDQEIEAINVVRKNEGSPPIHTPLHAQRRRRREKGIPELEEQIAEANGGSPCRNLHDLGAALSSLGLEEDEWEVDLQGRLIVRRLPHGKKRRRVPIRLRLCQILQNKVPDKSIEKPNVQPRVAHVKDRADRITPSTSAFPNNAQSMPPNL